MSIKRHLIKLILPRRIFEAIKADTKQWLLECTCGHKRDVWDEGGIRYKANGKPSHKCKCPKCGENTWHKIRKKTDEERQFI